MPYHDTQPQQDLSGAQATAKIHELASEAHMCMFATDVARFPGDVRPMAIQQVDEQGIFWFLSARDSRKNRNIASDGRVLITCQNDARYAYLVVSGAATVLDDPATIAAHWIDMAKAWFDGPEDPRLTVIRVAPVDGHYWQTESGKVATYIKMRFAALTGDHPRDVGVSGDLSV